MNRGDKHRCARLNSIEVQAILMDPSPTQELAWRFGVNPRSIRKIRSGQIRKKEYNSVRGVQ
jgi:hypothetical protein